MSTYDVFQRCGVHSEDDWPENGTLRDSTPQRVRVRPAVAHLDAEVEPNQIGPEVLQRHPSHAVIKDLVFIYSNDYIYLKEK